MTYFLLLLLDWITPDEDDCNISFINKPMRKALRICQFKF